MSFAIIHTRARVGIEAPSVTVETHRFRGAALAVHCRHAGDGRA
jgi:hypothetical protein